MTRETAQRRVIRNVLENADRPLSPLDILTRAQLHIKRLGIATVYRTLKDMQEENQLCVVNVDGSAPHYELSGKDHHHHFKCEGCETILDVDACVVEKKKLKKLAKELGFTIRRHDLTLFGLCDACTDTKSS